MDKLVECGACHGLHVSRLSRCPHCDTERGNSAPRRGRLAVAIGLGTALSSCVPLLSAYGICTLPDGGFCDVEQTQDSGPAADGGSTADAGEAPGSDSGMP